MECGRTDLLKESQIIDQKIGSEIILPLPELRWI